MSDTTINRYVASGTAAQRVAFTPAPATPASGPSPLCIWYETDTGDTYMSANAAAWVLLTGNALNVLPWKRPCRAKTTGALAANTYANGTAGVGATLTGNANGALAAQDGITLVAGESLLVANEAAGLGNGIYTVTQVGTGGTPYILTRRNDATSGAGLVNATVKISEGTAAADQEWQCTTNSAITVGTTAQVWAQAGGSGGGTTTNAATFAASGGAAAGTTFDGSAARTIDYSTVGASPLAGNKTLIGETSANSILTTFTVSSIPSTYRGLEIHILFHTPGTTLFVRFNNDSSSTKYQIQKTIGSNTTTTSSQVLTANEIALNPTNNDCQFLGTCLNYNLAVQKLMGFVPTYGNVTSGALLTGAIAGCWNDTTTINRIDVICGSAPTLGYIRVFGIN